MRKRAVFVTNIPAPYRERVHEAVYARLGSGYHVVFCAKREPNRAWDVDERAYDRTFLRERFVTFRGRYIHANPDIWSQLERLAPEVVITTGFNPTALLAVAWCVRRRRKHVVCSDTWAGAERNLTVTHKAVRRFVYARSAAFIGASQQTLALFRSYGAPEDAMFQSPLCADNAYFAEFQDLPRIHDLVFSGRISEGKLPGFFTDVARRVKAGKPDLRVLVLGDGPQRTTMLADLEEAQIAVTAPGFVKQRDLPAYYASGRVLLFPTKIDAWGIVANEACAAGMPVITCEHAGCAGELVVHGHDGYVLGLDPERWASNALRLLQDEQLHARFSAAARAQVAKYTYEHAAEGIIAAIDRASAA